MSLATRLRELAYTLEYWRHANMAAELRALADEAERRDAALERAAVVAYESETHIEGAAQVNQISEYLLAQDRGPEAQVAEEILTRANTLVESREITIEEYWDILESLRVSVFSNE